MPQREEFLEYGETTYTAATIGSLGVGNRYGDPLFRAPAWGTEGDYHLRQGSPAIDAADATLAPVTDLEGHPRYGPPDMGAYESLSPLTIPLVLRGLSARELIRAWSADGLSAARRWGEQDGVSRGPIRPR